MKNTQKIISERGLITFWKKVANSKWKVANL